jgi:antitoxin VapB
VEDALITATAKIFQTGRSQDVLLPEEYGFDADEVKVTKKGDRVILEPLKYEAGMLWDVIDSLGDQIFMPEGREQSPKVEDKAVFEL